MRWDTILPQAVAGALASAEEINPKIWLVGGAVRDHFLKRPTHDFDFAVAGNARRLARRVADLLSAAYYDLDAERDTGRVLAAEAGSSWRSLDFAGLRGQDIQQDLGLRDFTVNALALTLDEESSLRDPSGGLPDLKAGVLRLCHPQGIEQDSVRAVRAVRLAAELGFKLDDELIAAIMDGGSRTRDISVERVRDELFRIFALPRPAKALRIAGPLKLAELLTPGLTEAQRQRGYQRQDHLARLMAAIVGDHLESATADWVTGQASVRLGRFRQGLEADFNQELAGGRSRRQLLHWVALYIPEGYPPAKLQPILMDWRLSRAELAMVSCLSQSWRALDGKPLAAAEDGRSRFRYFNRLGKYGAEMALLGLADLLSRQSGPPAQAEWEQAIERARVLLTSWYEGPRAEIDPAPLIRGDELVQVLGLAPGPIIGELLAAIREEQAAGEVETPEQALEFARRRYQELK